MNQMARNTALFAGGWVRDRLLGREAKDLDIATDATPDQVEALFERTHAIGKKVVEEAAEVWMAAEYQSDAETAEEISQLLYHLQVMMLAKGLSLEDVYRHL